MQAGRRWGWAGVAGASRARSVALRAPSHLEDLPKAPLAHDPLHGHIRHLVQPAFGRQLGAHWRHELPARNDSDTAASELARGTALAVLQLHYGVPMPVRTAAPLRVRPGW